MQPHKDTEGDLMEKKVREEAEKDSIVIMGNFNMLND